jgi:two-component system chemotaxis response regulator CheB
MPQSPPHPWQAGDPPLVAIAASAGGIPALRTLLAVLPPDFPAAVLVVVHLEAGRPSLLAEILDRVSALPVRQALAGERPQAGVVYIAPPDRHLVVDDAGSLALIDSPREHHVRPSADPLFASVAQRCGSHAVAVVLSGMGRDGSDGVAEIHRLGGTVVAQDSASSLYPAMPDASVATGFVDHVVPIGQLSTLLVDLLTPPART